MKRIYLLMTLALGFSTAAFAQRSVDMQMTQTYPTGGFVSVSEDEDPDMQTDAWAGNDFSIGIKNLGPDVINGDDTAIVGLAIFGQYVHGSLAGVNGIAVGDEVFLNYADLGFTYDPDQITNSQANTESLCDSLYMVDVAGAVIADPVIANNHNCASVTFNIWFLNVNDVNKANGFSMYPNPAATKLNLVSTFNNAKNANVIIRDVVGKTVFTQNLGTNLNGKQTFALDISNFVTGMYVIELNVDGNRITRQIQVQK